MFTILLIDGYYIEVDDMNCTLKYKYVGKTKDGEEKESIKTIGYYPDINSCLEKLVKLKVVDELDGRFVDMREYCFETCEAVKSIYSIKLSIEK